MSIIDSFFVALGVKADPKGVQDFKTKVEGARESIFSLGTALKGLAFGYVVKQVAHLGSSFEQNRIQIAGYLSALGQSSDFNAGLQDAAAVIQQITADAAKLPGEADEYVEVFKAGLPFVKGAMPGGSLKDMTDFTNRLTAIGKTFGLDSGTIAREFDHMLSPGRGMAGLRLPLFRQLMPFMRQVQGQSKLTAESFNAMTAPQRLQLLQSTFAQLQPMLNASAESFDAMWGAAVSATKQMVRMGTVGLFKGMKQALEKLNALFFSADGKLTSLGQRVVDVGQKISGWAAQVAESVGHVVMWFARATDQSDALKFAVLAITAALVGMKRIMVGGLLGAIALVIEDLYQFERGGKSVTGMLVKKWAPAIYVIEAALGAMILGLVRTQIFALFAARRMAVAWGLTLGPLTAIVAGVWMLAKGLKEISSHWTAFKLFLRLPMAKAKDWLARRKIGHGDKTYSTGFENDHFEDQLRAQIGAELERDEFKKTHPMLGPSAEEFAAKNPAYGPELPPANAPVWTKVEPADMYNRGNVGVTNVDQSSHVRVDKIEIHAPDAEAAGREVERRLIRNGQTGQAY